MRVCFTAAAAAALLRTVPLRRSRLVRGRVVERLGGVVKLFHVAGARFSLVRIGAWRLGTFPAVNRTFPVVNRTFPVVSRTFPVVNRTSGPVVSRISLVVPRTFRCLTSGLLVFVDSGAFGVRHVLSVPFRGQLGRVRRVGVVQGVVRVVVAEADVLVEKGVDLLGVRVLLRSVGIDEICRQNQRVFFFESY